MFYLATDARKDRSEGYQCNTRCKSGTSDEAGVVVTVVGASAGGVAGAGGCIAGAGAQANGGRRVSRRLTRVSARGR